MTKKVPKVRITLLKTHSRNSKVKERVLKKMTKKKMRRKMLHGPTQELRPMLNE